MVYAAWSYVLPYNGLGSLVRGISAMSKPYQHRIIVRRENNKIYRKHKLYELGVMMNAAVLGKVGQFERLFYVTDWIIANSKRDVYERNFCRTVKKALNAIHKERCAGRTGRDVLKTLPGFVVNNFDFEPFFETNVSD